MARMLNVGGVIARTTTVAIAGTAVQLPDLDVPDGVSVLIKAAAANTGTCKLATTAADAQAALGVNNFPLTSNQTVTYQIRNPNLLFVDSNVASDSVHITFEY